MGTFTPKALVPVTQLTASAGTSVYTQPASVTSIVRTIHVIAASAAKTFTLSFGADAAATRLFDAYALTANVPSIFNGWWVTPGTHAAHEIDANASAVTSVQLIVSGYEWQ